MMKRKNGVFLTLVCEEYIDYKEHSNDIHFYFAQINKLLDFPTNLEKDSFDEIMERMKQYLKDNKPVNIVLETRQKNQVFDYLVKVEFP